MLRFFRYLRSQYLLGQRLNEEEKRQLLESYSIQHSDDIREPEYIYEESSNKRAYVWVEFSWLNDVVIRSISYRWFLPQNEKISNAEKRLVEKRLIRYFSCWGGEVELKLNEK